MDVNERLQFSFGLLLAYLLIAAGNSWAQTAPSRAEESVYSGLHAAASKGDAKRVYLLVAQGANVEVRDPAGRTPLHVAAFNSHEKAVKALAEAGADSLIS